MLNTILVHACASTCVFVGNAPCKIKYNNIHVTST